MRFLKARPPVHWTILLDRLELILMRFVSERISIAAALFGIVILGWNPAMAATQRWIPTGGPEGGDIRALAINPQNPTTLYAGVRAAGVFKSTNGAYSWAAANAGLGNESVFALAIDSKNPETLYAGTDGGGVFKSSDGGASWSAVNTGLGNLYVRSLAYDSQNPGTIYVGTMSAAYKSINGGDSWFPIITLGPGIRGVYALAIDPKNPLTVYAGINGDGNGGVFKSSDGGSSWSPINIGFTPQVIQTGISSTSSG